MKRSYAVQVTSACNTSPRRGDQAGVDTDE